MNSRNNIKINTKEPVKLKPKAESDKIQKIKSNFDKNSKFILNSKNGHINPSEHKEGINSSILNSNSVEQKSNNLHVKKKEESRKKILKAASILFRKQGYHTTGVDSIMGQAGLTAGAFYAHFHSKSHLLEEVIKETLKNNFEYLTLGLEKMKGEDLVQTLRKRYLSLSHKNHPESGCIIASLAPEIFREIKVFKKNKSSYISDYINNWFTFLYPHLRGTEKEKRKFVLKLISELIGALILSRITSDALSDEFLEI